MPIAGAQIYLLQASTTGYGGANLAASSSNKVTSLLTAYSGGSFPTALDSSSGATNGFYYVTTDANGRFSITGEYIPCTTGAQVYLLSLGGKPDGVNSNPAAGLMAVLGPCGSFGANTTVNMNELSTIAAAYAMAGFATDATHVGAPASGQTGLANAFANAQQLFDVGSSPYSTVPTARTTTPGSNANGTGTVPQTQVNTLADIIAACVDSTGLASSSCTNLLTGLRSAGNTGTIASDTATEAIYMAHNPSNIGVYGVIGSVANPYTPYSKTPPNDLTITLSFTGAGLAKTAFNQPNALAIDGNGNAWAVSPYTAVGAINTVLSEFSPLGVPVSATGLQIGLNNPLAVAIDQTSSTVWVANFGGNNLVGYNIAGGNTQRISTGNGSGPMAVAPAPGGLIWTTTLSNTAVAYNTTTGAPVYTAASNGLSYPTAIAGEPGFGDFWVANLNGYESLYSGSGTAINNPPALSDSAAVACDNTGYGWFLSPYSQTIIKFTPNSAGYFPYSTYASGSATLSSIAFDGGNNAWIASSDINSSYPNLTSDDTIYELSDTGSKLNGAGYQTNPDTKPGSIAVDNAGNIWYTSLTDSSLREILGAAVPVATPISYGVANNLLGARP